MLFQKHAKKICPESLSSNNKGRAEKMKDEEAEERGQHVTQHKSHNL